MTRDRAYHCAVDPRPPRGVRSRQDGFATPASAGPGRAHRLAPRRRPSDEALAGRDPGAGAPASRGRLPPASHAGRLVHPRRPRPHRGVGSRGRAAPGADRPGPRRSHRVVRHDGGARRVQHGGGSHRPAARPRRGAPPPRSGARPTPSRPPGPAGLGSRRSRPRTSRDPMAPGVRLDPRSRAPARDAGVGAHPRCRCAPNVTVDPFFNDLRTIAVFASGPLGLVRR